jgi:hypothetical protein
VLGTSWSTRRTRRCTDFEVRQRHLEWAQDALARLHEHAARAQLSQKAIIQRATRILVETKSSQYFRYVAERGGFSFWLRRDVIRPRATLAHRPREPRRAMESAGPWTAPGFAHTSESAGGGSEKVLTAARGLRHPVASTAPRGLRWSLVSGHALVSPIL